MVLTFFYPFLVTPCSVLHRPGEHLRPHRDVLVLWPGSYRPTHAEVSVVEEIPHVSAAGKRQPLHVPRPVK